MHPMLRTAVPLLLTLTMCPAVDKEVTRDIPPDFPEIDFGIAHQLDHFKVKVHNACGLTGSSVGGLWIGRQISKNEWVADADIPKSFARSH